MFHSLRMHEEHQTKTKDSQNVPEGAVPAYLLDREGQSRAKVLSNMVKQKRKEKAVSTVHCILKKTVTSQVNMYCLGPVQMLLHTSAEPN